MEEEKENIKTNPKPNIIFEKYSLTPVECSNHHPGYRKFTQEYYTITAFIAKNQ